MAAVLPGGDGSGGTTEKLDAEAADAVIDMHDASVDELADEPVAPDEGLEGDD